MSSSPGPGDGGDDHAGPPTSTDLNDCALTRSSSSSSLDETSSSDFSEHGNSRSDITKISKDPLMSAKRETSHNLGDLHNIAARKTAPNVPLNTPLFASGDSIYARFRPRSQSLTAPPYHDPTKDNTALSEVIRDLKSFQQYWTNRRRDLESQTHQKIAQDGRKDSEPAPKDSNFEFPFFHLSPADFQWQEYRFPFSRLDTTEFRKPRQRVKFPFSHLDPDELGWALGQKKKPDSPLEKLMQLVGLEEVKKEFLSIQSRVKAFQERVNQRRHDEKSSRKKSPQNKQNVSSDKELSVRSLKLDLIISGPVGTGKSTIARLYAGFLDYLRISPRRVKLVATRDRRYSRHYISSDDEETYGLQEIYDLDSADDMDIVVVEGDKDFVRKVLAHPKARNRLQKRIDINDYSESELLLILIKLLKKDAIKTEGGYNAPFLRTLIRRLKQQKGQGKFQNVRALELEIKKAHERRASRLEKATSNVDTLVQSIPNPLCCFMESDFLGAKPSNFYENSENWKELEKMAGMDHIRSAVRELVTRRHVNHIRERDGKEPLKTNFNMVFLGPPGTGKTTVATLFGKIISELGYMEDSEVMVKKPTDFLGQYVGHSEEMTTSILKKSEGKVLIIDEAHMFYHASEHGGDRSDIFRKGIIDTIVAHFDNEPGNKRCIILMGYPDRMKEFYRNTNPGFQRRFPLETAFVFENYDNKALRGIMDLMLTKEDITATHEAKDAAMEVLRRERDLPNFGNGGAVRNLISRAQVAYSKRLAAHTTENLEPIKDISIDETQAREIVLQPYDFDPEYDRGLRANKDFRTLFKDLVGFRDIMATFEGYQKMAANMKGRGLDPREEVPFSFVFKGPPGTGKTTTARALGEMYHAMGFLSTTEVLDRSVTDLIASDGLTGRKVQNLLERSLGKVLLIDEAYRMGQRDLTGAFISRLAQEALGELVDCMTKEKFLGKLVIVLAGYENDMNQLISTNEGLRSRFTELMFPNMKPKDCLRLLQKKLEYRDIYIPYQSGEQVLRRVIRLFEKLSQTVAWANARDVESIAKIIRRQVFMTEELPTQGRLYVTLEEIVPVLRRIYRERRQQNAGDDSQQ